MTFEHLWSSFIDILKFQSAYAERQQAINRYQILRNEYSNILQKIEISQIFITTHAYYQIEDVTSTETFHKLTFENIIQVANEKDNLTIFDFKNILDTNDSKKLDQTFTNTSDLEIMFLNRLKS